ncbi:MAG TPA: penicillin-binding protein activator [Burkholderiales bacterium]|nr:penicillin-binding protein activator [Burkholderiales bacterium]
MNFFRHVFVCLLLALLSACAAAPEKKPAAPPAPAQAPSAPAPPPSEPQAQTAPLYESGPPPAIVAIPLPEALPPAVPPANRHIALILPLDSQSFASAAGAVQDGFLAASATAKNSMPVKVYPTGDRPDDIVAVYRQAVQAGAQVVVGPLTRNGVTALAASNLVVVPTLALNTPDSEIQLPRNFYLLGLQVEAEGRQAAKLAWVGGARNVLTIFGDTPLFRRVNQSFVDEWLRFGGTIVGASPFAGDPDSLLKLRDQAKVSGADAIFLALDAKRARMVRPYLDSQVPTYATSHVYSGRAEAILNHDLNGIRFIDSPWVVQADHPAVKTYPHPAFPLPAEMGRLYALGIDAFRIAELLLLGAQPATLDGAIGRITLNRSNQFERELIPAIIRQGEAMALERALR